MSTLAELEETLAARQNDMEVCNDMLSLDPGDPGALETIPVLEAEIAEISAQIAAEKANLDVLPPPPPPPKYDMSKHPKFLAQSSDVPPPPPPPTEEVAKTFNVGELVMAKFSEDKQWYQATIISKTGSSSDPVYSVTFKGYGNTETNKRKHEIRATESKKRKVDGSPVAAAPQAAATSKPVQQGTVISAAPSIDTTLVQKREPSKVSDGPTRMAPEPKKLKGNKALEKSKSNWNAWQQAGPKKGSVGAKKKLNKDSQFRTPDLPNAKVGFTGSGKPMQKDQARAKWNYGDSADE